MRSPPRLLRELAVLLLLTGLLPSQALAEGEAAPVASPDDCIAQNVPEPDTVRALRLVARDRLGNERVTVLRAYGSRGPDGRRMLLRFVEPKDVVGSALLLVETNGTTDVYFRSDPLGVAKRITGGGMSSKLFGSDFSYEDLQYLQGFQRPGSIQRHEDAAIGARPVYVVERRPAAEAASAYDSVISFVDQERCMPLRLELFEADGRLRKVLDVNPEQILRRGGVWVAHQATMRDIRDYTTTQLLVDTSEHEALDPSLFEPASFLAP